MSERRGHSKNEPRHQEKYCACEWWETPNNMSHDYDPFHCYHHTGILEISQAIIDRHNTSVKNKKAKNKSCMYKLFYSCFFFSCFNISLCSIC